METWTQEYDDVVHEFGTISTYFSKLMLGEVYSIEHVAMTKIRIRENALAYQATKQTRKTKIRKPLLHEKEQEIEAREQSRLALAEAIKITVTDFLVEES